MELPEGITFVENSHLVRAPWKLAFTEKEVSSHGVRHRESVNILFSEYVPSETNQPNLEMSYPVPFWELGGSDWELFKKRVVGFSAMDRFGFLSTIKEDDLDDLKDRLTGDWLDG